jgi:hypothetical protein
MIVPTTSNLLMEKHQRIVSNFAYALNTILPITTKFNTHIYILKNKKKLIFAPSPINLLLFIEPLLPTSLGPKASTIDVNLFRNFTNTIILDETMPISPVASPECKPNSPLFKITSMAIDVDSSTFADEFYPKACVVSEPSKNPYIITGPPDSFTSKELQAWSEKTLPDVVKQPLFDINGKKIKSMRHRNILFTSEYRFCHIIPFLYLGDFLGAESKENLHSISFLAKQFSELMTEYESVDTDPIRGFDNYKDFQDETELNKNRIHLHSAALL